VLFIGSFRDNDEDASQELSQMLDQLKSSAEVTEISVSGFDSDTLNDVVSESLCIPKRKTRALSEIILAKTEGVPIHIIEVSSVLLSFTSLSMCKTPQLSFLLLHFSSLHV
jgi:predicted ATPase